MTFFSFPIVQRKTYDKPTHIAQTEEPWSRLHDTATLASSRRSVLHYERQVTSRENDYDLHLCNQKNMSRQTHPQHFESTALFSTSGSKRQPRLPTKVCLRSPQGLLLEKEPDFIPEGDPLWGPKVGVCDAVLAVAFQESNSAMLVYHFSC